MAITRTDAIGTTIIVGFTVFLLEICKMLLHKGIDLKYEWASDASMYLTLLLLAQIGIAAVIPIAWLSYLRKRPELVKSEQ